MTTIHGMNGKMNLFGKMTSSKTEIPPQITTMFDAKLLSSPLPGMKEPQYYRDYYGKEIEKRCKVGNKRKEYEMLMQVYEEMYEWKKAKEVYDKAETKKALERPIVPFKAINRVCGGLGKTLRMSFGMGERRMAA